MVEENIIRKLVLDIGKYYVLFKLELEKIESDSEKYLEYETLLSTKYNELYTLLKSLVDLQKAVK